MKIAGSYFKDNSDRVDSVIEITLDDNEKSEVTFSSQNSDVQICVDIEDLERIVKKLAEANKE